VSVVLKLVPADWCCQNKPVKATMVMMMKADIQRFSSAIFIIILYNP